MEDLLIHIDAAAGEVCMMPALPIIDDNDDDDGNDDALPDAEERKTGRTPNVNAISL